MHTLVVIGVGFLLLIVCALTGRALAGSSGTGTAALVFVPLWLIGAAINLYLGVLRRNSSRDPTNDGSGPWGPRAWMTSKEC